MPYSSTKALITEFVYIYMNVFHNEYNVYTMVIYHPQPPELPKGGNDRLPIHTCTTALIIDQFQSTTGITNDPCMELCLVHSNECNQEHGSQCEGTEENHEGVCKWIYQDTSIRKGCRFNDKTRVPFFFRSR